jgi:hypothetical protein
MNYKGCERKWFDVLSRHLSEESERNHENLRITDLQSEI